jgi:YVTN family beta-propeller protein
MGRAGRWLGLLLALGFVPILSAAAAAVDEARHYAFVPSLTAPQVTVIDTRTDAVVANIATGGIPYQLAVSLAAGRLVVGSLEDRTVRLFDLSTFGEVAAVQLGHAPEHMQLAPTGDVLAIGNFYEDGLTLLRLDAPPLPVAVGGLYQPHNLVFSADGRSLFVANLGADRLSRLDVAKGVIASEITVTPSGTGDHDGPSDGTPTEPLSGLTDLTLARSGLAYVLPAWQDALAVLDLAKDTQIAWLPVGAEPLHAYATTDGRRILVPSNGDATISIIDGERPAVLARLPGEAEMMGAYPAWFDRIAFVPSRAARKVLVFDLDRLERMGEVPLPAAPERGSVTGDGSKLYLALPETGQVAVIDARTQALVRLIDGVGPTPMTVVLAGDRNYCD